MKLKHIIPCLVAVLLSASAALSQTTLAKWTFETSQPGVVTLPATPGAGVWLTNIVAEIGTGTAAGWHKGSATYSSPAGNGSAKSFSANTWTNSGAGGDLFQFAISTVSFQGISVSFDVIGSATGPKDFNLFYSTDGVSFTQFGSTYNVASAPSWSASSTNTTTSPFSFDLSSITAINNASVVYFRLVVADNVSINGSTVASSGTSRIDNFTVISSGGSGPASIVTSPQNVNAYYGDSASFSVLATGNAPIYYKWFYSASGTVGTYNPLADGSSGYGSGTISGSATANLALASLNPAQAGYYEVGVSNSLNSSWVFSSPAQLTVGTRIPIVTTIYKIRTNQTVNWFPVDTTNLYTVTGTVTTPFNMTASTSRQFYIQDSTAGIVVFVGGGTVLPNQGDSVQVTGPIGQYNGLLEFNLSASNPTHIVNDLSSGNPVPTPKFFDFSSLTNIAYVETNIEGSLVIVSNVFIQQPQVAGFVGGASINMTNVNGKLLNLFINANASDVIASPAPVFASSIIGVFSQYTTSSPATNSYELDILQYAGLTTGTTAIIPLTVQQVGTNAIVTWNGTLFGLQSSTNVAGPYTTITGAQSPYIDGLTNAATFYRLIH